MSNVIKFPKGTPQRESIRGKVSTQNWVRRLLPLWAAILATLVGIGMVIRYPLFLVLYWLRFPVMLICNLISIPLLFAWLFALYAFPDKTAMIWGFGLVSLGAFVVTWIYDLILGFLSPTELTFMR